MFDNLLIHNINIYRITDKVIDNQNIPFVQSYNITYTKQDVTFDVKTTNLGVGVTITGLLHGITHSAILTFNTVKILNSNKKFDKLLSISASGTGSASVFLRSGMGQPIQEETLIISNEKVRIDNVGPGNISMAAFGTVISNRIVCFTRLAEDTVKQDDIVLDTKTNKRYKVIDTNVFYDSEEFHHQELTLQKLQ